jgi:hypothetical protein
MTKKTASDWLYFYCESLICLCGARSCDVFCNRTFSFSKGRKVSLHRLDAMTTIGYYLAKRPKTSIFIFGCIFMENLSDREIAERLNKRQRKKKFHSDMIRTLYIENIVELYKDLAKAKLISK